MSVMGHYMAFVRIATLPSEMAQTRVPHKKGHDDLKKRPLSCWLSPNFALRPAKFLAWVSNLRVDDMRRSQASRS